MPARLRSHLWPVDSGMARLSCATGDTALRDKAILLTHEWEKTLGDDGNPYMGTYAWESDDVRGICI